MEFKTAIRSFFTNYATFSGRARRSEYWWVQLFLVLTVIVTSILDSALFGVEFGGFGLFGTLTTLGTLVPALAVTWRRLHDIGKSGGFFFLALIPLVGIIILIVWLVRDSDPKKNMFGPNPKSSPAVVTPKKSEDYGKTPKSTTTPNASAVGRHNQSRILLWSGIGASVTSLLGILWTNMRIDTVASILDPGFVCAAGNLLVAPIFQEDCPLTEAQQLQQTIPAWGFLLVVGIGLIAASIVLSRRDISAASNSKSSSKTAWSVGVTKEQSNPELKKCPMCAEDIKIEAKLCKHCGTKLDK